MKFECLCLSLKTDMGRRTHMNDVFNKMNIPVSFFDAVTPHDLTKEDEARFNHCDFYEYNINQKSVMATFISHTNMLKYSISENKNLLIIEDDLDYVIPLNFNEVDFGNFDILNIGLRLSCYSYFVSKNGSERILKELESKIITQAYDWELSKLNTVNSLFTSEPHFIQVENKFISNIAPNGYIKN